MLFLGFEGVGIGSGRLVKRYVELEVPVSIPATNAQHQALRIDNDVDVAKWTVDLDSWSFPSASAAMRLHGGDQRQVPVQVEVIKEITRLASAGDLLKIARVTGDDRSLALSQYRPAKIAHTSATPPSRPHHSKARYADV
ncbi:hypothetical protein PG993_013792 [Apiospora rasikravindrae]|uniref:Uncharacterized protein n=1 Tax=Apiospora rasikravindrae TaxID=990691 RepID=A0ABR1RSC6_9PEZI